MRRFPLPDPRDDHGHGDDVDAARERCWTERAIIT
jgi:hypothetical protein